MNHIVSSILYKFVIRSHGWLGHNSPGHCTPRALPQNDYVILQGASDPRERGNLLFKVL